MKWVKLALGCLFAGLLFSGVLNPILAHLSDKNWLSSYLAGQGYQGYLWVALAAFVLVTAGGPKQVVAFLFGYLYGAWLGTLATLLLCLTAALANYLMARVLLSHTLAHYFPRRMNKFNQFASRAPFMKILMLRLLPVGSNLVTNLLSGSVGVPLWAFISASVLGYLPQTVIFALVGHGINGANHAMIYTSVGLSLLSFVLTALIYRDHLKYKLSTLQVEGKAS
ncbi:TVP38/TMEM64 family protein [Marinomonas pollencensis]|uniref:TVP38/TMEM64 family membrane protein n=1 Tax=Marinomonas pollencensis TaxID=491954 RepID=A0A3E0DSW1_9GAMM|nr:VTT domain-containing protein [Marinomonas pollencensis]REG86570.1 putative membrane protein YdjX (TVP38/TMEM64 family) [Marinomonas pollencensis]